MHQAPKTNKKPKHTDLATRWPKGSNFMQLEQLPLDGSYISPVDCNVQVSSVKSLFYCTAVE